MLFIRFNKSDLIITMLFIGDEELPSPSHAMDLDSDVLSVIIVSSCHITFDDLSDLSSNKSPDAMSDSESEEDGIDVSVYQKSILQEVSSKLSSHSSDSSTNHSSVMTPDPITLLERLDESELPIRGNVIPNPDLNFNMEKYLTEEWFEDKNSIVLHPLISVLDPELISIDGSLHKSANLTVGPSEVSDHLIDEDCIPPLPNGMSDEDWSLLISEAFDQAVLYSPLLVPGAFLTTISPEDLTNFKDYLLNLRKRFRQDGLEQIAADAAKGFNWSTFDFKKDFLDLRDNHNGNIASLCAARQKLLEPESLNLYRVRTYLAGYPLLRKVEKIVDHGIHIYPDPKYKKNPYEPLRPQEIKLSACLCKNALKLYDKGKLLIFDERYLLPVHKRHMNFNATFWVPKVDSPDGRLCVDPSNRSDGRLPINGGLAKEISAAKYGQSCCYQMYDIVFEWYSYILKNNITWELCWMAKEDCKTYFNQFKFHPKSCLHMCRRISPHTIIVELFGNYGSTVLPGATQVVGKAMEWKLRQEIDCPLHLFFDDFMIFGMFMQCVEAYKATQLLIKNVLGPGGLALEKHCHSQCEVMLGYLINLIDPRGACIGPKLEAIDKMMHLFFNFDPTKRQSLLFWQIRASYAERYSQVLIGLRPFVSCFHHMVAICSPTARDIKLQSNRKRIKREVATASTQFAIEVWRMHLLLLWKDPSRFSLPLEQYLSFNKKISFPARYLTISDACYKGIAIAIFEIANGSCATDLSALELVGWMYVPLRSYTYKIDPKTNKLDTSRFQNYLEYMGVTLQFILFNIFYPLLDRKSGFPTVINVYSDSENALSWHKKNKCKTQHSQVACWCATYLSIHSRIQVAEFKHIAAVDPFMKDIDRESRRDLPLESLLSPGVYCDSLPHVKELDIREYPIIETYVEMVDPTKDFCKKGLYHENYVKVVREFEPFVHRSHR
jgi:hypothetical protein